MFSIYLYFTNRVAPAQLVFETETERDGAFDLISRGMSVPNGRWFIKDMSIRTDKLDFISKIPDSV